MVTRVAMTFPRDELRVSCFINFCFLASTEALEFAMTKLTPFGRMQKYIVKLEVCFFFSQILLATSTAFICFIVMKCICCCHQDFMTLLAYEELDKAPMFRLLSLEHRQQVADNLNRAILGLLLDFLCAVVYPFLNMLRRFMFSLQGSVAEYILLSHDL
jgi:hypothetical protein